LTAKTTPQIYHYANSGVCSWYDLAESTIACTDVDCKIIPVASDQYEAIVDRPHYSVLNQELIYQVFNVSVSYWRSSLIECLRNHRFT